MPEELREEEPFGPRRRLNLGALDEDSFELLCYLVVFMEFPDAIRLDAPDDGADAALPSGTARSYARCWQFKCYPGHIHWQHCKESLERAVGAYSMPLYTFCFPRDLTGSQEKLFKKHLVGKYPGVAVDWWGQSRLVGALLSSPQGERIARHFYGDPRYDAEALGLALRSGGALERASDAEARLDAIAAFLAKQDPFFSYPVSIREAGLQGPSLHPGSVMAVEKAGPDFIHRFEAVPRNQEAMARYCA